MLWPTAERDGGLNCYWWSPGQHGKLSLKAVPTGSSSFLVGPDTLEGDIRRTQAPVAWSWEPWTSHCLAQVLSWWECSLWWYPASWQPLCGTGMARSLHYIPTLLPWAPEHNGSDPVSGWAVPSVSWVLRAKEVVSCVGGKFSQDSPWDRWPVSESGCGFFSLYLLFFEFSNNSKQSLTYMN